MAGRGERERAKDRERDRVSAARQSSEKETKALSVELAELLKKRDPWHQDVVFARENLRRHCLALIFQPAAGQSASARSDSNGTTETQAQARRRMQGLNMLFLSTSHSIIHHFRQKLSAMDKQIAAGNRSSGAGSNPGQGKRDNGDRAPNASQRRRLLHSFRDFLVKEESFWRDLLIRIVGVFDVEEARTPLRLLHLGLGDWEPDPEFKANKEIHDQAVLLCHKTLICFGDLARYRELYSESNGKTQQQQHGRDHANAAPHGKSHKSQSGGKADSGVAEKDWSRAYEAYHQARLLLPDDGNPSNQLAVLAGYQHDTLASVYHYYRALCTKKAFTTARHNLSGTLEKALQTWDTTEQKKVDRRKTRNGGYKDLDEEPSTEDYSQMHSAKLLQEFRTEFIALHAMLFQGSHIEALPAQFTKITRLFSLSVNKRALPSDVIVKTTVTAISAWWYARMYRRNVGKDEKGAAETSVGLDPASLESSALMHALAIIAELLNLATAETRGATLHEALQPPPTAPKSEYSMLLAQSITAVFRRALPALRISSMWLLSNTDYLARYDTTSATFRPDDTSVPAEVCSAVRGFWTSYATFANSLSRSFPLEFLPVAGGDFMLEEDIDMLGFAPLRRRTKDVSVGKAAKDVSAALAAAAASTASLHPNEEQVLRIGDLLGDVNLLVQSDTCPLTRERGSFAVRTKRLNPKSQPWSPVPASASAPSGVAGATTSMAAPTARSADNSIPQGGPVDGSDDENDDDSLRLDEATEDDVLDLAMRVATGNAGRAASTGDIEIDDLEEEQGDDDDDEILYPSSVFPQRRVGTTMSTPSPTIQAAIQPIASSSPVLQQPSLPAQASAGGGRTASDLLLQVLQGNSLDLAPSPVSNTMQQQQHIPQPTSYAAGFSYGVPSNAHSRVPPGLTPSGATVGNNGFSQPPGLGGRSIWSSPLGNPGGGNAVDAIAPPSYGIQNVNAAAPGPGSLRGGPPPPAIGSAGSRATSAEALFNSMPNQSQPQQRTSPQARDRAFGTSHAGAATPAGAATQGALGSVGTAEQSFWSPFAAPLTEQAAVVGGNNRIGVAGSGVTNSANHARQFG